MASTTVNNIFGKDDMNGGIVWLSLNAILWVALLLTFSCAVQPQIVMAKSLLELHQVQAIPDDKRDIACFLSDEKIKSMVLLDGRMVMRRGLPYVLAMYNLDGGEKVNVSFLYPISEGRILPFPTVYIFGDVINSPKTTQVYVDQTGDGVCKSITFEPKEKE